jgi:large subunit ribosomal protein L9
VAQVKLILREDVEKLGEAGELVTVRPGFARNFLLPQGKALLATAASIKELEHHQRIVSDRIDRERKAQLAQRDRLQQLTIEITAKAGEEGRLFGSVTASQIAELIAARGIEIDRRKIQLDEPLKDLGEHLVPIRLFKDVIANVKVKVTAAE